MAARRYQVTGGRRVAGTAPGDTVELDPDAPGAPNVAALVTAGHLTPVDGDPAPAAETGPPAAPALHTGGRRRRAAAGAGSGGDGEADGGQEG